MLKKERKIYHTRFLLFGQHSLKICVEPYQLSDPKFSAVPRTTLIEHGNKQHQIDTIKRATPLAYDIGKLLHPIRLLEALTHPASHRLEYRILVKESSRSIRHCIKIRSKTNVILAILNCLSNEEIIKTLHFFIF